MDSATASDFMVLRSHTGKKRTASHIRVYQVYTLRAAIIQSAKDAKDFRYMTKTRSIAKLIDVVEVTKEAGNSPSFQSVMDTLHRTINITTLTLRFSFPRIPPLRALPKSLVFHQLTSLNVNIPHATLAPFLKNHSRITNLVLGSCNASNCPLTNAPLPRLRELACPPGCVRALTSAGRPLGRLFTSHGSPEDSRFQIPRLLNFNLIETSATLTVLYLDFDRNTTNLLQRISTAAPALSVLRLTESPFSVESGTAPWDDGHVWEDGLRSLTFLERLYLRTRCSLKGSPIEEDALVRDWLVFSPPHLCEVITCTKALTSERLVRWDRQEQGLGWSKYEVNGDADGGDFF